MKGDAARVLRPRPALREIGNEAAVANGAERIAEIREPVVNEVRDLASLHGVDERREERVRVAGGGDDERSPSGSGALTIRVGAGRGEERRGSEHAHLHLRHVHPSSRKSGTIISAAGRISSSPIVLPSASSASFAAANT